MLEKQSATNYYRPSSYSVLKLVTVVGKMRTVTWNDPYPRKDNGSQNFFISQSNRVKFCTRNPQKPIATHSGAISNPCLALPREFSEIQTNFKSYDASMHSAHNQSYTETQNFFISPPNRMEFETQLL